MNHRYNPWKLETDARPRELYQETCQCSFIHTMLYVVQSSSVRRLFSSGGQERKTWQVRLPTELESFEHQEEMNPAFATQRQHVLTMSALMLSIVSALKS